ncbi:MAG: response regulator [Gammaproteobacteria bacterium]
MGNDTLKRILVVEDEPDIRAVAKLALEAIGHFTVKLCGSGAEALEAAKDFAPDLILLDVMMPGMDGPATLQRLRTNPATAAIPVIFLTAKTQASEMSKYRSLGALDVIPKPFDPMTLATRVRAVWRQQQAAADDGDEVCNQLETLRQTYLSQLPGKLSAIKNAWAEIRNIGRPDSDSLKTLHLLTHSLAGSSATFGFTALGELGHQLEMSFEALLQTGLPATPTQRAQIDGWIDALQSEAANQLTVDVPAPSSMPEVSAPGAAAAGKPNRLVFMVEDDALLAKDLAQQVGYFGYQVRTFSDLNGFKEAIAATPPAAIIMDIMLPEGSLAGVESIAEVQKTRDLPVPVIFLSARGDLATRLKAFHAGGYAYFTKPVEVSDLIDKLDTLTASQPPDPYRVLIVEDDPLLASHYALILRQAGIITSIVSSPAQVMQALVELRPDLILMDVYMPECSGMELAAVIRQQEAYVGTAIVFLSSETNVTKQLEAMHWGADDFLTKPIQPGHLVSSLTTRMQRARTLRAFMVNDSLTGLLNHSRIKERIAIEIARVRRENGKLAFALIDIDHFKSINDNHGHLTGDRVIKNLSRLLRQRLRETDIIGRYGGEEFAVILPGTDGAAAHKLMDEIRSSFAQLPQRTQGDAFTVTFSTGIAVCPPYENLNGITDAADKALYEAKHQGRNRTLLAQ